IPRSSPAWFSTSARKPEVSVLGDFVLAWGAGAAEWISGLKDWTRISKDGEPAQAAVRGQVQRGTHADGSHWLAIADLVEGQLADGASARNWRGRFAHVAWHPQKQRVDALTDHFSTLSLYTLWRPDAGVVGTDFRVVSASPWCGRKIDL